MWCCAQEGVGSCVWGGVGEGSGGECDLPAVTAYTFRGWVSCSYAFAHSLQRLMLLNPGRAFTQSAPHPPSPRVWFGEFPVFGNFPLRTHLWEWSPSVPLPNYGAFRIWCLTGGSSSLKGVGFEVRQTGHTSCSFSDNAKE